MLIIFTITPLSKFMLLYALFSIFALQDWWKRGNTRGKDCSLESNGWLLYLQRKEFHFIIMYWSEGDLRVSTAQSISVWQAKGWRNDIPRTMVIKLFSTTVWAARLLLENSLKGCIDTLCYLFMMTLKSGTYSPESLFQRLLKTFHRVIFNRARNNPPEFENSLSLSVILI